MLACPVFLTSIDYCAGISRCRLAICAGCGGDHNNRRLQHPHRRIRRSCNSPNCHWFKRPQSSCSTDAHCSACQWTLRAHAMRAGDAEGGESHLAADNRTAMGLVRTCGVLHWHWPLIGRSVGWVYNILLLVALLAKVVVALCDCQDKYARSVRL